MTDTQKNAIAQAAERLFDFADDFIPQPTPKAAQDFTDPENYWHRAALAALPQPAPVTGGEDSGVSELREMLNAAEPNELGGGTFDHTPEEIGMHVMEHYRSVLAALSPSAPAEDEREIAEVSATMHAQGEAAATAKIVAWLREGAVTVCYGAYVEEIADAIERGNRLAALSPSVPEAPSERGVGDWHPRIGEEVRPSENMIERWPDWRDTRLWVVGVTLDRNVVGNPTRGLNVCVSDEWPVTNRTGGFTDGFYINRDHAPDDLVPLTRARKIGGNHHGS